MKFLIAILFSVFLCDMAIAAQTYNCSYFNQIYFGATTISTLAVAKNSERRCLLLQNNNPSAASQVLIRFGSSHRAVEGLTLAGASATLEFINVPTGAIYLQSVNSGNSTTILEGK